jgi:hypothetical protein
VVVFGVEVGLVAGLKRKQLVAKNLLAVLHDVQVKIIGVIERDPFTNVGQESGYEEAP